MSTLGAIRGGSDRRLTARHCPGAQATGRPERFAGRLRAALNFGTIDEILEDSLVRYVESIRQQCDQIHAALNQTYISYTIETAIAR